MNSPMIRAKVDTILQIKDAADLLLEGGTTKGAALVFHGGKSMFNEIPNQLSVDLNRWVIDGVNKATGTIVLIPKKHRYRVRVEAYAIVEAANEENAERMLLEGDVDEVTEVETASAEILD